MRIDWSRYDPGEFYDELISTPGNPRMAARSLAAYLGSLSDQQLNRRQRAAELAIEEMGITFTVYSEGQNIDRSWPFDIIPRVIAAREWQRAELQSTIGKSTTAAEQRTGHRAAPETGSIFLPGAILSSARFVFQRWLLDPKPRP